MWTVPSTHIWSHRSKPASTDQLFLTERKGCLSSNLATGWVPEYLPYLLSLAYTLAVHVATLPCALGLRVLGLSAPDMPRTLNRAQPAGTHRFTPRFVKSDFLTPKEYAYFKVLKPNWFRTSWGWGPHITSIFKAALVFFIWSQRSEPLGKIISGVLLSLMFHDSRRRQWIPRVHHSLCLYWQRPWKQDEWSQNGK